MAEHEATIAIPPASPAVVVEARQPQPQPQQEQEQEVVDDSDKETVRLLYTTTCPRAALVTRQHAAI